MTQPNRTPLWIILSALCLAMLLLGGCSHTGLPSHGRFAHIAVIQPRNKPAAMVLLLSGAGEPNRDTRALALALAGRGALVATLDTTEFLTSLDSDRGCSNPDGDLDNLGHYLEAAYGMPGYRPPILAGVGQGATLAFAAMAQAEPTTFAGGLAVDFDPGRKLSFQPCTTGALVVNKGNGGVLIRPAPRLQAPWFVLEPPAGVDKSGTDFAHQTGHAAVLPTTGPHASRESGLAHAYRALETRQRANTTAPPAAAVADLPLIEMGVAPGARSDTLAIMLSGDGGWAGLDQKVGQALAASGIPVVGYDSLRYYWKPRTPDEAARDLARVIDYYRARWHTQHVLLIGYSLGADVMPFLVNRLPAASLAPVARVVMLGPGSHVQFEFHVWSWLGLGDAGEPVAPQIAALPAGLAVCIYGTDDSESICGRLDASHVQVIALAGGHHFGGGYDQLARLIRGTLPRSAADHGSGS